MRVWLINSSEMVPTDPGNVRLRRMGILADRLVSRGHEVVWWTAAFQHSLKTHRFPTDTSIVVKDGYRLHFLHAPGYRRNISLARLRDHHIVGCKFKVQARKEAPPAIILCSFPTLELSTEAVAYGREQDVPVVLDIRDMWPDIFLDVVPRWCRGLARLALSPMFRKARAACTGAFAISGHAPGFVDWGLAMACRPRGPYDKDFPFGYAVRVPGDAELNKAREFWESHGVRATPGMSIVCFIGAVGHMYDLKVVVEAARRLRGREDVLFVLCGVGVRLDAYRKMAADCANVVFPGWANAPEIWTLMQMSSFGLLPCIDRYDFEASFPNKSIEYLAGGLPVLTSLGKGALHDLLREHDCGASYGGTAQGLADVISSLCAVPSRRQAMADRAVELFKNRFEAGKVYGDMAEHLENIAAARGNGPRDAARQ